MRLANRCGFASGEWAPAYNTLADFQADTRCRNRSRLPSHWLHRSTQQRHRWLCWNLIAVVPRHKGFCRLDQIPQTLGTATILAPGHSSTALRTISPGSSFGDAQFATRSCGPTSGCGGGEKGLHVHSWNIATGVAGFEWSPAQRRPPGTNQRPGCTQADLEHIDPRSLAPCVISFLDVLEHLSRSASHAEQGRCSVPNGLS